MIVFRRGFASFHSLHQYYHHSGSLLSQGDFSGAERQRVRACHLLAPDRLPRLGREIPWALPPRRPSGRPLSHAIHTVRSQQQSSSTVFKP